MTIASSPSPKRDRSRRGVILCAALGLVQLFLCSTWAAPGLGIADAEVKPRLFVLAIGINKYSDARVTPLSYARQDAEAAGRELAERAGGNIYQEVKSVRYLLDESARRAGILSALDQLETEVTATDTLVVYFSGRGLAQEVAARGDRGSVVGGTSASFYLFPADMDPDKIEETGISSEVLQIYLRKIRAKNKLFLFDSCHSGFGYDSIAETFTRRDQHLARENVLFVGLDTLSYDDNDRKHGVMTSIFLDALAGEADFDHNGTVTSRELEAYVYRGSLPFSAKYRASGGIHPRTISAGGDFNIALTNDAVLAAKYAKLDAASLQNALNELKPKTVALSTVDDSQIVVMEKTKAPLVAEKADIDRRLQGSFGLGGLFASPDKMRLRQKSKEKADEIRKIDDEIAAKKAELDAKKKELERLKAEIAVAEKALAAKANQPAPAVRAEIAGLPAAPKADESPRQGHDYALLFANDEYTNWSRLANPYNDVTAVASELRKRYGFKDENIAVLRNLTKAQMEEVFQRYQGRDGRAPQIYSGAGPYDAKNYKNVTYNPDDQLLVFFAGHGHAFVAGEDAKKQPVYEGLLVAADSPKFTSSLDKDKFLRLADIETYTNLIPVDHIMLVFDSCFSGKSWQPNVATPAQAYIPRDAVPHTFAASYANSASSFAFAPISFSRDGIARDKYIRRYLGKRSRVLFTSGGEEVPDGYCEEMIGSVCKKYSDHSPFAARFVEALRKGGNYNVLLALNEMRTAFLTLDQQRVIQGRLDVGSDGDFLFIAPSEK